MKKLVLYIFILFFISSPCWGAIYFVDATDGDDSKSGTSEANAWKTLSKVNSTSFSPGDTIKFQRGEVWSENLTLTITYSGTSENWITFTDYGTGNLPKWDFTSNSSYGVYILNRDYIRIQNIHIYNSYNEGLLVFGSVGDLIQGFELLGSKVENCGQRRAVYDHGIDAYLVNNLKIADSIFDNNYQTGIQLARCTNFTIARTETMNHGPGDNHDGILVMNSGPGNIYDIYAHDNGESGIDLGVYESYPEDNANINVYRCLILDNSDDGLAISGSTSGSMETHDIYVYYTISHGSGTYNLKMYENAYNLYFYNSVFDGSVSHNIKWDVGAHDVTFKNCIFSNAGGDQVNKWGTPDPYNWNADYNIWDTDPGSAYRGTNYIIDNPDFTNQTNDDFTLQSVSPAINAGWDLGASYDDGLDPASSWTASVSTLDQDLHGAGWEIGAYVYPVTAAALTGTLADGATEAEIVAGGETLIITLSSDTWVPTFGDDNQITTDFIAGLDSGGAEAGGWDAEVKGNMVYTDVARTNATTATVTLGAEASYAITQNETITLTIPASSLTVSSSAIVATPTFEITASNPTAVLTGTLSDGATEAQIVNGGETIIITLADVTWHADIGGDSSQTNDLIANIDSAQSEAAGWDAVVKANMVFGDITRDSDTQVTVLLGAEATYDISENEVLTVTLIASTHSGADSIVATPSPAIASFDTSGEEVVGMTLQ